MIVSQLKNTGNFFCSFVQPSLTITCSQVEDLPNNRYRLHGIQIVNGCQTSNSLYQAAYNEERVKQLLNKKENEGLNRLEENELKKIGEKFLDEKTSVLTKIIETNDNDLIYRITETTNSQTPIKTFSLKANDNTQILIEEYLKDSEIYYERRVNFYKNQGKRNLITIQRLFQLYLSQIEVMPSQVKTRPKSFFDTHYDKVFPSPNRKNQKFELYKIVIIVDQAITKKIRHIRRNNLITDQYKLNLLSYGKFHLGCFVLKEFVKDRYNPKGIALKAKEIENTLSIDYKFNVIFNAALDNLKKTVQSYSGNRKESIKDSLRKTKLDEMINIKMKKQKF